VKLGIGLPNHIAGVPGAAIVQWARRAEERGFESVTTIDRLRYPGLDSLIALAAAAGATTDMTLVTNVLLAPVYPVVPLAKQIAGVAQISGGRLVVGLGVGNRPDDYASTGADFGRRGRVLDEQVEWMRGLWAGTGDDAVCATPIAVPLLFGGRSAATVRRVTTVGDGWAAGAVRHYGVQAELVGRIRSGWAAVGREGSPYLQASVNFGIGSDAAITAGKDHLARYYGFNPAYAQVNVDDMVSSPDEVRETVRRYRDLGFDRLLFHPTTAGIEQLDRLADAIL
jgi:alkanesulfonate monooxygenase SsuD/methylene tetrahydromethanopterin reductase-like flavin-dependent oxidoreductase (luciferase family)